MDSKKYTFNTGDFISSKNGTFHLFFISSTSISSPLIAMISLSVIKSRMKDFYDIFTLLNSNNFDGRKLQEAVNETLQTRHTVIERENVIFTEEFMNDENRIKMWKAFLRKINSTRNPIGCIESVRLEYTPNELYFDLLV